ncbi:glycosyltransferase family 2 protein [Anaerophaga thermohalophila]|uniref:glycosyltransferase family 2 protein n=1 Tax=Anaerophaga thermohalophila TaxID=177400 RepID=UPI000237D39A|nr:glycosyltransferase family 2 protein [Anaerophaga thermohalophila]
MSNHPLVSVGLAVYNGEEFISRAIKSVLAQTLKNWELIIVNDGSTDNTLSVIKSFSDKRIKVIDLPQNVGVTAARNHYLKYSKGKYIAVIDSDDEWYPTKLEKQVNFLETNKEHVVCGTFANRTNGSTGYIWQYPVNDEDIRIRLLWGSSIIHSSILICKSILDNNNLNYDCNQIQAEDYKLICECTKYGKAFNIPEVLLNYYEHRMQLTTKKLEQAEHSAKAAWYYINNVIGISISDNYFHSFFQLFIYQSKLSKKNISKISYLLKLILNNPNKWFNTKKLQKSISARFYIICSLTSLPLINILRYKSKNLISYKQAGKLFIKRIITIRK